MIRLDRKAIRAVQAAAVREDLYPWLQNAIELEHSTIPPYLTAMFSLKPGTNDEIARLIRSIVLEEMLHMTIVGNILIAIGGHPAINVPRFICRVPVVNTSPATGTAPPSGSTPSVDAPESSSTESIPTIPFENRDEMRTTRSNAGVAPAGGSAVMTSVVSIIAIRIHRLCALCPALARHHPRDVNQYAECAERHDE